MCERCFGPLEVAYDHSRLGARHRRAAPAHPGRTAEHLALRRLPARRWTALPGPRAGWPRASACRPGCTPLIRADRLAQRLGLREVWVKNDAANPTHSFKDRVVSVAVARARELGFQTIACASTGNLANSVAAHGAALGLESYVFIPADLEEQKVLATGVYGTQAGRGARATTTTSTACAPSCRAERDWAFVNVNLRPYYAEGSKTLAFEIAEQLGWELPDRCVVPVASGSLFTKIAKGFEEWRELGPARRASCRAMNGAQAEGCAPVASAFAAGHDVCRPVKPDTIAKSLAIGNPADGPYALELARRTGGSIDAVSDEEIRAGIALLAQTTGIFTETAGGVTTAVLAKLAAARRHRPRRARRARDHRRGPEDAGRGARHVPDARDRPAVEQFEALVEQRPSIAAHREAAVRR